MKKLIAYTCVFLWLVVLGIAGSGDESSAASKAGKVANKFVSLLVRGDFQEATADFDNTMKAAMPPDKLADLWKSLPTHFGDFRKTEGTRIETHGQYLFVFVTCRFEKQLIDVRVIIDQADKIAGLLILEAQVAQYRAPAYANKSLFREREVTIGSGQWALPGTLAIPAAKGLYPVVILVHGSGPHDKDESIGPNKPFQDLAWGLASRGIAVLRYEKRTHKYAAKMATMKGLTVKEEAMTDAVEAVALMQKTEGINPKKIFILGHSLGGMLAPRIAENNSNIAGLIILAGATRPLEDLILEQTLYQSSLSGEQTPEVKSNIQEIKNKVNAVKKLSKESPDGMLLGAPAGYWLDLKSYNPTAVAGKLKIPMLILQGERDCQVRMVDFDGWSKALSKRADVNLKSYPTLNHLFMVVQGQSTGAEYQQASNVAEIVISDIADWIKKN